MVPSPSHPTTPQPETLGYVLLHFRVTDMPPPVAIGRVARQLPVVLRGAVAFVVTCETCLQQVLLVDRIGDEEEKILRAHLATHPKTPEPQTLPGLLNRFRITTPV